MVVTEASPGVGLPSFNQVEEDGMPPHFIAETAIFETFDANTAAPRKCGLCNANPPTFAYRSGQFANDSKTGHCCTPCACRHLMEMAERSASGGTIKNRNAS